MPQSTISVIVPSYNHAVFIKHALDSICKQKVAPNKLIVIDDGSKDDSVKIIEKSLKECPFPCELIARENRGLSATLNEGLAKTTGEYFAYLGSDDIWLPDFLANRLQLLESRPNDVLAFGHSYLIDEHEQIIDCTKNWYTYSDGNSLQLLLKVEMPLSPSVVYRRKPLEKYGWNENSILEDYELYLKLAGEGEFALDVEVRCAWRQHNWNVSKDFPLMLNEWLEAQNRVAGSLGINLNELENIQRDIKFKSTKDLIRLGKKKEALRFMLENRKSAKSISEIGDLLFRLTIPNPLFQWYRRRKFRQSIKTFGKLEV